MYSWKFPLSRVNCKRPHFSEMQPRCTRSWSGITSIKFYMMQLHFSKWIQKHVKVRLRSWFTSERANSLKVRARGLHATTNKPLTSSEAWASRPGEGGGLDTSGQNCSRKCLDACGLLCSPWRLPRVGARWASRERLSSCCGDVLPLIRCHASWSFYTWSVYSGTIFSPRKRGKLINTTAVNNQHQ